MEKDRHLPLQGIPKHHLVLDEKTSVTLAVFNDSEKLIGNNQQERSGGRLLRQMRHDFYRPLHIDEEEQNKPIGY